nr:protein indeterminate-domain 16-like [Ipomoea trifida]
MIGIIKPLLSESYALKYDRVETFIEHQDSCKPGRKEIGGDRLQTPLKPAGFFPPIFNLNLSTAEPHSSQYRLISERKEAQELIIFPVHKDGNHHLSSLSSSPHRHTLELRELFPSKKSEETPNSSASAAIDDDDEEDHNTLLRRALRLRSETKEVMKVAMEQKAKAAEKRKQARVLMEMANQEMEKAKKIREQAFVTEIRNSQLQKDRLTWQMLIGSSSGGQHRITCDSCKMNRSKAFFQESAVNYYFPSAITHGENGDNNNSLMFRPLRPS